MRTVMMALVAVITVHADEDALRDWQEGRTALAEKKLAAAQATWDGPKAFAMLARAWATMGRERMLLKLVDEGLLRTAHLLDDDPQRRAILRAAAENMAARPERELELWRKLLASYWLPADSESRAPREALAEALQRQSRTDEAIALLRSVYADHPDSEAAWQLVVALMPRSSGHEEAVPIAREWFARSELGSPRAHWVSLLAELLYRQGKLEESRFLRAQYLVAGVCGGFNGLVSTSVPEDASHEQIVEPLAGSERASFDALLHTVQLIGSLDASLARPMAQQLADDLAGAFSRAYLSVHPREAINAAVLLVDRLAMLGLAGPATEIARRTEALLIEHQGEDSPLLEQARSRLRPNPAAPNPAP